MLLNHSLIHVLILVVVDNGLVQDYDCGIEDNWLVLILVVVDNGLVQDRIETTHTAKAGLNPCCSGQWSSTGHPSTSHVLLCKS